MSRGQYVEMEFPLLHEKNQERRMRLYDPSCCVSRIIGMRLTKEELLYLENFTQIECQFAIKLPPNIGRLLGECAMKRLKIPENIITFLRDEFIRQTKSFVSSSDPFSTISSYDKERISSKVSQMSVFKLGRLTSRRELSKAEKRSVIMGEMKTSGPSLQWDTFQVIFFEWKCSK